MTDKTTEELEKLREETKKLQLEIRDLGRPIWQRNIAPLVTIVTTLVGLFGSAMLTIYTTGQARQEKMQRELVDRFRSGLAAESFDERAVAAKLLSALDPQIHFEALRDGY